MKKKVYVAMSGGVDSSVAAALLCEQGYSVVGVFMKFWSPNASAHHDLKIHHSDNQMYTPRVAFGSNCIWKEERQDALRVAAKLGIPLLTWDFTREYEKKVVAYMLEAYRSGVTPNPDIMCNKEIKFGLFFDRAMAEGAGYVATGHYARIQSTNGQQTYGQRTTNEDTSPHPSPQSGEGDVCRQSSVSPSSIHKLLQAADKNKDQSYFLYTLDQHHLAKTLFPIGEYTKPQVRELAKKFELPTAEKKDSQGVCFIGPLKMREFLKDYIKPKKGKVIYSHKWTTDKLTTDNGMKKPAVRRPSSPPSIHVLGEHNGAWYYTIGQRHGIDIKDGGGPYYVIGKDVDKNILYVGDEDDLLTNTATVSDVHWIGDVPELPAEIGVKIRYRGQTIPATINYQVSSIRQNGKTLLPSTCYLLIFSEKVRAVAPGQAAVFYDGEKVLGGGILK